MKNYCLCALLACALVGCANPTIRTTTPVNCARNAQAHRSRIQHPRISRALTTTAIGAALGIATGTLVEDMLAGGVVGGTIGLIVGLHSDVPNLNKLGVSVIGLHGDVILIIPSDKLFEINRAELRPSGPPILDAVAHYLKNYPNDDIEIASHTDPISLGSHAADVTLSLEQAKLVYDHCRTHGLKPRNDVRQVTYVGVGPSQPLASNDTLAGMRINRRVQITISANCSVRRSVQPPVIPPEMQQPIETMIKYSK